ncbi:hypothetical protein [Cellulomonas sp. C5510]|uniref:hypothetical protein n=1 Tax=Cellulomonas sp. C5510 TaxID=2871170 RepID=UPI001C966974|nr:hypothetical protein [Cellulomonas sp. C5510]QZN87049.1 hypothetical protein K5O09_08070 [Cellulomonas sp. C5510]
MLCVAAFVVLLVLGAVSAKYRALLRRAWGCVSRRVTFRPCDTSFREDVKNSLLAPLALRSPRLVRPASIAIEVTAWAMVLSLVVSGYVVARSGLNLVAYGTCNKENPQACSLSATQGCSIDSQTPTFAASLLDGDVVGAFRNEFSSLADTITAVPGRFRTWDGAQYATSHASYLGGYRDGLPTALEVIDPGCQFCAQLFTNIEESGFAEANNLTYIVYPITLSFVPKFANSPLVAQYLTAIQLLESADGAPADDPTDWFILEQVFTGSREDGTGWQVWLNEQASPEQAEAQLQAWLAEAGYDQDAISEVDALADSARVEEAIAQGRAVVEDEIRTLTVPTLIANGDLHLGVVETTDLEAMR